MKKELSILALSARTTLFKVIGVILITAVLEIFLFFFKLHNTGAPLPEADYFMRDRMFFIIFYFGLGALIAVYMGFKNAGQNGQIQYTAARLSLTKKRLALTSACYHFLCLTLYWAVQIIVYFVLIQMYVRKSAGGNDILTGFELFGRDSFMHTVFPMKDWLVHIRNLLFITGFSLSLGLFSTRKLFGAADSQTSKMIIAVLIFSFAALDMPLQDESSAILAMVICAVILCVCACQIGRLDLTLPEELLESESEEY